MNTKINPSARHGRLFIISPVFFIILFLFFGTISIAQKKTSDQLLHENRMQTMRNQAAADVRKRDADYNRSRTSGSGTYYGGKSTSSTGLHMSKLRKEAKASRKRDRQYRKNISSLRKSARKSSRRR